MILSNPFNQQEFTEFVKNFLPNFKLDMRKVEPGNSGFREVLRLGTSPEVRTEVLVVRSSKNISSRISLTNNSFKILKTYSIYRALVVYVNDDESIWRLSLLTATPTLSPDGKTVLTLSNPRRHSYVLGTDVGVATARKYLSTKGQVQNFADLEFRFSVEAVNKDFYSEIAQHFYTLVGKYGEEGEVLQKPALKLPNKKAGVEDLQNYSVRLLGRIIFLWFLRQKESLKGNPLLPSELLSIPDKSTESILHVKIEPLFFEVLNKPVTLRIEKFKTKEYEKVPYLNGGLFHANEGQAGDYYENQRCSSNVQIPNSWFEALLETLNTYNFTIDENLENDVDLSIDPEMLGRVFENLLAEINPETGQIARKSTGSYYTPRAIVNYMVDQALEEYLVGKTGIERIKLVALLSISKQDDVEHPLTSDERSNIVKAINQLKVLDPACGSGAFPIGMLQKLLWIISEVDPDGTEYLESSDMEGTEHWLSASRLNYLRKRKIIRDVIFGTDIQSVAIEIAKLRCFLTLIVDQEIDDDAINRGVVPLPNLDFKFICANSLIPLDENRQISFGDDPNLEEKLTNLRKRYFNTTNEEKKAKLKLEFEKIISSSPSLFEESKRNLQLKSFHPLSLNNQAKFFDPKTMFGYESFPVIIGNPPYKVLAGSESQESLQELKSVETYKYAVGGRLNLYRHFIERSTQILSDNGVLSFIVPSTLIADKNTAGIRKMFREVGSLKFLIEFPEKVKVFESVTQATTIFLFSKSKIEREFKLAVGLATADLPPKSSVVLNWELISSLFGEDLTLPLIKSPLELDLIRKIKNNSFRLDQITSCWEGEMNQTFKKKQISNKDTGHIFVRGEHLSSYLVNLDTENCDRRWFDLDGISEPSTRDRLACQGVSNMGLNRRLQVAYIPKGIILGNSLNYIDLPKAFNAKVLLALLNSSLLNWYFKKQSTNNNVNVYELNSLPIRNMDSRTENKIVQMVKEIESLAKSKYFNWDSDSGKEAVALMEKIDSVIFKAYELNTDEIKLINGL